MTYTFFYVTIQSNRFLLWHPGTYVSLYCVPIHSVSSLPVHCFWIVNSLIAIHTNLGTSQGSVFPPLCLHTSPLPAYRCLLFSCSSMTLFWHSRVGFHPWSTVGATGRHSWKCGLNNFPSHSRCCIHTALSLCYSLRVLASQGPILAVGLLGRNQNGQSGTGCCLNIFQPKICKWMKWNTGWIPHQIYRDLLNNRYSLLLGTYKYTRIQIVFVLVDKGHLTLSE